ncbi:hypothetical protein DVH05_009194 [Phytophthora capsici]|nr:hypothetical protein DVH05_009194 [Phytophthora capsici]
MEGKAKTMSVKASKTHLRVEDLHVIVGWLEHPPNFAKCFGKAGKTSIGKQSSKSEGFKEMAAALALSSNGKFRLKATQMRDRFATYKNRYIRTKEYESSTGAGVTAEDESNSIFTMKQKLEFMCPWYERMDALFGHKSNVTPLDAFDSSQEIGDVGASVPEGTEPIGSNDGTEMNGSCMGGREEDAALNEASEVLFATGTCTIATSHQSTNVLDDHTRPRSLSFTISDDSDIESTPSIVDIPLAQDTPVSPSPTLDARTTLSARKSAASQTKRSVSEINSNGKPQLSKKTRLTAKPTSLNASPLGPRGSGSRIAKAMQMASESKANGKDLLVQRPGG